MNTYCTTCRLKRAQIFAIFIKDLKYQVEKEARPETDLTTIVPTKYHNLLDVFSKNDSYTLSPHQMYDHKIILEDE